MMVERLVRSASSFTHLLMRCAAWYGVFGEKNKINCENRIVLTHVP